MQVNLEGSEAKLLLFAYPGMIVVMVLLSVGAGHYLTTLSHIPTEVRVTAAAPSVAVNVPQAQAPQVNVASSPPRIEVNVPNQPAPVVNVTTPPAVVQWIEKHDTEKSKQAVPSPSIEPPKPEKASVLPQPVGTTQMVIGYSFPDPKNRIKQVVSVDDTNFATEISDSRGVAIVDFNAKWCGPCRTMSPIVDALASEGLDAKIAKLDVDIGTATAAKFGVTNIPCFVIFKDGKEIDRHYGVHTREDLQGWVTIHDETMAGDIIPPPKK